jgi:tetratricopeptide (TPR) repeat protein
MPTPSRYLTVFASAIFALGILAASVSVGLSAPIDDCAKLLGRAAIAPCTLVIDDKKESEGNRARAYLMRARAELDVSELEKAEADIGAGLALRPNNSFGFRLRGRLRGLQGRNDEARADYNQGVKLADTPNVKYFSYVDRGRFLTRIKEYSDALADFDAAIQLVGAKAAAYVGRAVVYGATGRIDDALASLERASTVEPTYWLTYVERGDILFGQKRYDEAVAAYDLALTQRPSNVRAQRGRAAAVEAGGTVAAKKPEEPTTLAMPAPQGPPDAPATPAATPPTGRPPGPPTTQSTDAPDPAGEDAEVRRKKLQTALDLRQRRKFAEALAIYDAMLSAVPTDVEAAIEKGRTLMQLARWKEALDIFQALIDGEATPDDVKAMALTAWSELFSLNNRFDEAITAASEALRLNPRLAGALYWRGYAYYSTGAFAAAIADFQHAATLVPKASNFPSWEALALIGIGDTGKAKEAIARSLAVESDNVDALLARARLNLASGDIAAAEADLAEVTRRGQPTPIAMQTQQLILLHKVMKATDQPAKPQSR